MNKILLSVATVGVLAAPALAFAQTYAYVNTSGEVMTMEAASANAALTTAPNIGMHSGVMLMDDADDQIVAGDHVSGS